MWKGEKDSKMMLMDANLIDEIKLRFNSRTIDNTQKRTMRCKTLMQVKEK